MANKTKPTRNPWSKEELKKLKQIFKNRSTKEVAKQLARSEKSVQGKATKLGLKKSKSYLKKIGKA